MERASRLPAPAGNTSEGSSKTQVKLPLEVSRKMERNQRQIDQLFLDRQIQEGQVTYAYQLTAANLLCFFAGVYVMRDGYRAAHPLWSPIRRFTKNNVVCKLTGPVCLAGMFMIGITAIQGPPEYWRHATAKQEIARIDDTVARLKTETDTLLRQALIDLGVPLPPHLVAAPSGGHSKESTTSL
jgi:hypothetical protein